MASGRVDTIGLRDRVPDVGLLLSPMVWGSGLGSAAGGVRELMLGGGFARFASFIPLLILALAPVSVLVYWGVDGSCGVAGGLSGMGG